MITVGQEPSLPALEQTPPQLPETTVVAESPQIAPATPPEVPTLAKPSTPGQVPETQRIPQAPRCRSCRQRNYLMTKAQVESLFTQTLSNQKAIKKNDGFDGGEMDRNLY